MKITTVFLNVDLELPSPKILSQENHSKEERANIVKEKNSRQ